MSEGKAATRHVVATVDEIPPGGRKIVSVAGRSIGVFNLNSEFFALLNRCPHQGGPLCHGHRWTRVTSDAPGEYRTAEAAEMLRCPWHGWEFDIRTGQSWFDPIGMRVRRYPVRVEPLSNALEKGPYVAETYRVHVEAEVITVEI
jgi:nitrite reductase/ring-hydroxylating ferredoxin subunit